MNNGLRMYLMNQSGQDSNWNYDNEAKGYAGENQGKYDKSDRMNPGDLGEMRRGDGNGNAYHATNNKYNGSESRYRGRDGRWKAGRPRGEFESGTDDEWQDERPEDRRASDEQDEYKAIRYNYGRVDNRYRPDYPIAPMEARSGLYDGGGIGFGTRDKQYETRSHYDRGENVHRQSARVGGMMWMEPQEGEEMNASLDRVTAEKWVRSLKNEDNARPTGGRWSMDELKPMAQKFGLKAEPDDEEFIEFYAITNAMYSDYCAVAKKFNITSPEYYGMMALAWMRDKDAVPNKTAMYYECCVKK